MQKMQTESQILNYLKKILAMKWIEVLETGKLQIR